MPWWVVAQRVNGRLIIDGPHRSEEDGLEWITTSISDHARRESARVVYLETRDKALATQQLKHGEAPRIGIDDATRNAVHPKAGSYEQY